MLIKLTIKQKEDNRRLVSALQSNMVPVNDLRSHLESIQKLVENSESLPVKRNAFKAERKYSYRNKLKKVA